MELHLSIAKRIKEIREKEKLTQEAAGLALGVSKHTFIRYETGETEPTASWLIELSKFGTGYSPLWIITGDGEPFTGDRTEAVGPLSPPDPPQGQGRLIDELLDAQKELKTEIKNLQETLAAVFGGDRLAEVLFQEREVFRQRIQRVIAVEVERVTGNLQEDDPRPSELPSDKPVDKSK